MKKFLKKRPLKLKQFGEYLLHWIEILLGVLVLVAVIIMTVYQFTQLAIGVEIARLLFSYSLETIIELAAFVVARKLLLLEGEFISLLLGIIGLVLLFGARHFFMEDDKRSFDLKNIKH